MYAIKPTTKSPDATVIAAMGGVNAAMSAERALRAAGIAAEVISLSPGETRRGCAYGVTYPADADRAARAALRAARLSPSQFLRR